MKKACASLFHGIFNACVPLLAVALFSASSATPASAQIVAIPPSKIPRYNNSIGFGISYGPFIGEDGSKKQIQALNAVGIVNYSFYNFTFTTGLSKGFANDDTADRSFRFMSPRTEASEMESSTSAPQGDS